MKIYFGGSIAGGRQDVEIYSHLVHELKKYGEVLTEAIGDKQLTDMGGAETLNPKEIHDREITWLKESNVLVAEVTTPSHGVGYELGFAIHYHKKILCLYRPSAMKRLSPMVEGSFGITSKPYETIEDAQKIIENYFKEINTSITVLVGSNNPVKVNSVREGFEPYFGKVTTIGMKVPSGVPDQPIRNDIYKGAENRAKALIELSKKEKINADYFVGIEGGIDQVNGEWFQFGHACILDKEGRKGLGNSPQFQLPPKIIQELLNGKELGPLMDGMTGLKDTKHHIGTIGILTRGVMDRTALYRPAITSALIPLLNSEKYF